MTTITDQQVLEFLKAKVEELNASTPGYVQIRAEATWLPRSSNGPTLRFCAYNEHAGHSPEKLTASEAIAWVRDKAGGRTEAEIIRRQIKELEAKAASLEAKDSPPDAPLSATDPFETEAHV